FFFSSRRRHTRCLSDWSSDVCSSDLLGLIFFRPVSEAGRRGIEELESQTSQLLSVQSTGQAVFDTQVAFGMLNRYGAASRENLRSEERRVGKEGRAWWWRG